MSTGLLTTVAFLLMLPGLIGVIVPILPGVPYMFAVAFLYALVTDFSPLTGTELLWLAGLAALSVILDYSSGILGARLGGASQQAMGYGLLGFLIGLILLPPLGGFLGMFGGIVVGELRNRRTHQEALRAGTASMLGSLGGGMVNLLVAIVFLVLFIVFAR